MKNDLGYFLGIMNRAPYFQSLLSTPRIAQRIRSHWDRSYVLNLSRSRLDLREGPPEEAILTTHPYQVYNLQGDLLYTIYRHEGIFGDSSLDQRLLLQSVNGEAYYLRFTSYGGPRTILLGIYRPVETSLTSSTLNTLAAAVEVPDMITFELSNGLTDSQGLLYPILIYRKSGVPQRRLTLAELSTGQMQQYQSTLFAYFPPVSNWIALVQQTPAGMIPLLASGASGPGIERWLNPGQGTYYLTTGRTTLNLKVTLAPEPALANIDITFDYGQPGSAANTL